MKKYVIHSEASSMSMRGVFHLCSLARICLHLVIVSRLLLRLFCIQFLVVMISCYSLHFTLKLVLQILLVCCMPLLSFVFLVLQCLLFLMRFFLLFFCPNRQIRRVICLTRFCHKLVCFEDFCTARRRVWLTGPYVGLAMYNMKRVGNERCDMVGC